MSSNFIVQEVKEYQGLEGVFKARVDHVEYIRNGFGNYRIVNWAILSPSEFEGRFHQERYNTESENEKVKEIAISNYSKFCIEIGGLKKGDEAKDENFLYKEAMITIRNRIGKNDGKSYSNIVKIELIGGNPKQETFVEGIPQVTKDTAAVLAIAGIQMPTTPETSGQPLNDEVPF